jgi:hypothetical protein
VHDLTDKFREWFGDEDAVRFANELWSAAQEWDDLEDEGKCDHNPLLAWLAFGKEYDAFFSRNNALLRPALMQMYLSWTAANVLDHEPDQIEKAYMLRAGIYQVWHIMAWICGGHDHAVRVGPDIYRQYSETVSGLKGEMDA